VVVRVLRGVAVPLEDPVVVALPAPPVGVGVFVGMGEREAEGEREALLLRRADTELEEEREGVGETLGVGVGEAEAVVVGVRDNEGVWEGVVGCGGGMGARGRVWEDMGGRVWAFSCSMRDLRNKTFRVQRA
jgi:hypothetical protein